MMSESNVAMNSIDGHMPMINYKTTDGVEKMINKLNLNNP